MMKRHRTAAALGIALLMTGIAAARLPAQSVTYKPYIGLGDAGPFGTKDQMVIAWQTDESSPNPTAYTVKYGTSVMNLITINPAGRVVDNYLAADPQFAALTLPFAYGAHTNYTALLPGLDYDTTYMYTVSGPGLPAGGFTSTFHTRKRGTAFTFQVQGDEGFYPGFPNMAPLTAIYEARIIHTMYNAQNLTFPGQPALPPVDFALNTGDNIYTDGADDNYRDMWFNDWNNDADSNEAGAPFIRHLPLFIVAGNHDVGATGATANLLAASGATVPGAFGPGPFGGNIGGGDALAFFNNYYYPLNGPVNTDIQYHFTGDAATPTNFFFSYNGVNYNSPAAIEALRASTTVNTGKGSARQIDHISNYSFDYGNAHFVFLDANPHVFDNLLPGGPPSNPPAFPFTSYPGVLRDWLVNDLDASKQTWKIVVFHQPAFSSGNATISNDQMRRVAKFLENHGVNMVFNGHEHNYQRSLPLRALPNVDQTPKAGVPAVQVDTAFDGVSATVPDGVLYFVEGAGGNRDFDDNLPNPRGGGNSIDQDDAATGTTTLTVNGSPFSFLNGPASFLDTSLTDDAMKVFQPGAGSGTKITAKFKSKVFSFAHIVVNDNVLTLYQITEPLTNSSSGTPQNPAPFGRDLNGNPLNDPIPDTVFNAATRTVVSPPAVGTPALLDKVTVTKPSVAATLTASLSAPPLAARGGALVYTVTITNGGGFALNGAQAVVTLPAGVSFAGGAGITVTPQGQDVVVTIGRLTAGQQASLQVKGRVAANATIGSIVTGSAVIRSGTALPVSTNTVNTRIIGVISAPPHP